jgi:hypothetical protein
MLGRPPEVVGSPEADEALTRLIIACQQAGEWRGLEVSSYIKQVVDAYQAPYDQYDTETTAYWTQLAKFHRRNRWTLGLHGLRHDRPTKPAAPALQATVLVFPQGGSMLRQGFIRLAGLGLVRLEQIGPDDRDIVAYPTLSLVLHRLLAPYRW